MSIPSNKIDDFVDNVVIELKNSYPKLNEHEINIISTYIADYLRTLNNISDIDANKFYDISVKRLLKNLEVFSDENIKSAVNAVESVKNKYFPPAPPPSSG